MSVRKIKLTNFKNYAEESIQFDEDVVAVVGQNGMGKTNLLDAIYYSCIGKSFFTYSDKHVVRKGEDFFRIETDLAYKDKDAHKAIIKVKPGVLKTIEVDGNELDKISEHIGTFPVVMIAPSDIQILLDGSEPRRLFMNNTIVQYSKEYLNNLLVYNRLLKQRNALLKTFNEKRYFDAALLDTISQGMHRPAESIFEYRQRFIERLQPIFEEVYHKISGGREQCKIVYKSNLHKNPLKTIFKENLERDRVLGRTSKGCHRDDLIFEMDGDQLKTFASQGQLKSFLMALKLAQYHILHSVTGISPILLLDDLFDKLDRHRVKFLLDLVTREAKYGQVIISDTHVDRVPTILNDMGVPSQCLIIREGNMVSTE